jgi:hypothetical protein
MEIALVKVADNQAARQQPSVVPCMCSRARSLPNAQLPTNTDRLATGAATQHIISNCTLSYCIPYHLDGLDLKIPAKLRHLTSEDPS